MIANSQLSLFEQVRNAEPELDDERIVSRLCQDLLDQAEVTGPPIPVGMIASLRGITSIKQAEQPFAGMVRPLGEHLAVRVRRSDGRGRKRFTVCHEVAHTLFPGFRERRRYRCNGERTWVERMCDFAGAELLLPRRFLEPDLLAAGFGLEAVEDLASEYQASIEATARRCVALHHKPAMLIALSKRHKPAEAGREDEFPSKLRVDYHMKRGDWPFVLPHKSASQPGLTRALDGESIHEMGDIDELLAAPAGEVRIDARRYGAGRVLALVSRA